MEPAGHSHRFRSGGTAAGDMKFASPSRRQSAANYNCSLPVMHRKRLTMRIVKMRLPAFSGLSIATKPNEM